MWKVLIILIIGSLLFTGCTHEHIMLSKLKESAWYKSQEVWAEKKNDASIQLNTGYIFAGRVKEVRYDYYRKSISDVILSPTHCLYAPSCWAEWFSPDPVIIGAKNDDFKDFPTVGEYWAFGVTRDPKNRYAIESAIKLFYDTDSSKTEK